MSMKFERKKKRGLAPWTKAFPAQAKALRPENTRAGGVRSRSQPEAMRMALYNAIKAVYLKANPFCAAHDAVGKAIADDSPAPTYRVKADQIHHKRGRDGLLLFDVREFVGCCGRCHAWIDANRDRARELMLLAERGEWRNG